ncbi:MAG: hypothetical protein KI793_29310 [Rivularia sp. (in: Bacteria)]|nr:hypothetical protein [Rivularia sp. MS3]
MSISGDENVFQNIDGSNNTTIGKVGRDLNITNNYSNDSVQSVKADWTKLLEQTRENLIAVPNKIGNTVFLNRQAELKAIETAFAKSKVVILLGSSGCGKTVIAKSLADKKLNSNQVIWWKSSSFDVSDFSSFQSSLRLSSPLRDVLSAVKHPAYVIIDGVDRIFSETAFQNLSALIHTLQLNVEDSLWRLVIPCQIEEWKRVQMQLARANVSTAKWEIIPVKEPSINDLEPVWETFPALLRLRLQPQLRSLLLKPKVLDLLATKLSTGGSVDTQAWVGESNLIEWFWETEVRKQPNSNLRASILKSLGEKQADNLEPETPIENFSHTEQTQLDCLINERLCQQCEERLSFYHDLYSDWSRQRVLLGKGYNLWDYIKPRISSPLWHRAVRLYGLHLLEQHQDITKWRDTLMSWETDANSPNLAQDLLLEAVIFAANPQPLLERLWSDLAANNGLLLRRLLGRFLYVATLPNPMMREIFSKDSETLAATVNRIPYWLYWLPMLRFLYQHLEDVVNLAPKEIAEIAGAWLWRGGIESPLRLEAAQLALTLAEKIQHQKQEERFRSSDDKFEETVYLAALAAVNELPSRLTSFVLQACGREELSLPASQDCDGKEENSQQQVTIRSIFGTYEVELPPPWSDGPNQQVDLEFQNSCLEACALHPIIQFKPTLAREVLLALLIEEPIPPDPFDLRNRTINDNLEIAEVEVWEYKPPLYNRGPFLFFLKNQQIEGLEVILRLVNFATERWAARYIEKGDTVPEINITLPDGEHKWIGDAEVYNWYRPHHLCPKPVVIALMALEKWLYDQIDKNESIDTIIELILQRSNSLAFAGLLSAVGCKNPSLFLGVLRPLLAVSEFHQWEFMHSNHPERGICMGDWWMEPEWRRKQAHEWYELSHRKNGLDEWGQRLFLNDPDMRDFFEEVRSNWVIQLQFFQEEEDVKNPLETLLSFYKLNKDSLEKLIAQYDIKNYSRKNHSEYGDVWVFNPPDNLVAKREKYLNEQNEQHEKQVLLLFPVQCLKILDKSQVLSLNELEILWNQLQEISNFTPPESFQDAVNRIEDCICGGAAVLLKLHRDWLREYPEREQWCVLQIRKTICNPPQHKGYDSAESLVSWSWEAFCAQVIPIIWAEYPDKPDVRECVALLALNNHYKTVETLFNSAANYRKSLGDNFKQLQHFTLRWAVMRWRRDYTHSEEQTDFNLENWLQQEVEAFVQKNISPKVPSLEELSVKEPSQKLTKTRSYHRTRRPKQRPGIDLMLIQAAYDWLPSLEQATDATERNEWINFWKEALSCFLQMLGEESEDNEKVEIEPFSKWDEWVIKRIATLILQLRSTEHPEEFWQPILGLGRRGEFWIDKFLGKWFINYFNSEPASDSFVKEWQGMIEFALSSPKWHRHSFYLEEAWCELMGFNSILIDLWTESQKPVVKQMHPFYQRWAKEHLKNPRCATHFIIFLKKPAAEEIVFDGLIWLNEAISQVDQRFWRERDIQDWLVSLLDQCWRYYQSRLRLKKASFDAFKEILKKLADFQNPMALEIQQRVAST